MLSEGYPHRGALWGGGSGLSPFPAPEVGKPQGDPCGVAGLCHPWQGSPGLCLWARPQVRTRPSGHGCRFSSSGAELKTGIKSFIYLWASMKIPGFFFLRVKNSVLGWLNGPLKSTSIQQLKSFWFIFSPFSYLPWAEFDNWLATNFSCWKFSFSSMNLSSCKISYCTCQSP